MGKIEKNSKIMYCNSQILEMMYNDDEIVTAHENSEPTPIKPKLVEYLSTDKIPEGSYFIIKFSYETTSGLLDISNSTSSTSYMIPTNNYTDEEFISLISNSYFDNQLLHVYDNKICNKTNNNWLVNNRTTTQARVTSYSKGSTGSYMQNIHAIILSNGTHQYTDDQTSYIWKLQYQGGSLVDIRSYKTGDAFGLRGYKTPNDASRPAYIRIFAIEGYTPSV